MTIGTQLPSQTKTLIHVADLNTLSHKPLPAGIEAEGLPCELYKSTKTSFGQPASNEKIKAHYKIIGETLSSCEESYLCIGIPWKPIAEKNFIATLREKNELNEFLRLGLVAVPSASMELYLEDLEAFYDDRHTLESLNLKDLKFQERLIYIFTAVVALSTLSFCFGSLFGFFFSFSYSTLVKILVLIGSCALSLLTSSESYRRVSFYKTLSLETNRRSGLGGKPKQSKMKFCFGE